MRKCKPGALNVFSWTHSSKYFPILYTTAVHHCISMRTSLSLTALLRTYMPVFLMIRSLSIFCPMPWTTNTMCVVWGGLSSSEASSTKPRCSLVPLLEAEHNHTTHVMRAVLFYSDSHTWTALLQPPHLWLYSHYNMDSCTSTAFYEKITTL